MSRSKSFPQFHQRYRKGSGPRNVSRLGAMAPSSTVRAREDSNSSDSMSHLQAFMEEQRSQEDSQGFPQGFQGLLQGQDSQGSQDFLQGQGSQEGSQGFQGLMEGQRSQSSREGRSVKAHKKIGFKVPPPVGSQRRSHFSDISEDGSGPSHAGSGKRLRFDDDNPEDGSGSSRSAKRRRVRFSDNPEDGRGPSRAGSSKRLCFADNPEHGSGPSRAGSAKRLRFPDNPEDGSGPSRDGSAKRSRFDDNPEDGSGPSRDGSAKRSCFDDNPEDGSGPSRGGSAKGLHCSDNTEDASSATKQPVKRTLSFSPMAIDSKHPDGKSPAEAKPSSLIGSQKSTGYDDFLDSCPKEQNLGSEASPDALSSLMKRPIPTPSDFFAGENTPPMASGARSYEDEDENTPVRKYGKAKRAMLRSQSMIVQSRPQQGRQTIPTPNLSPGSMHRSHSASEASIKEAVHKMTEDPNLIADSSKICLLPTISGKHHDLKSISHETLADLINGKYAEEVESFHIVDCRYPFEYDGGHIKNAVNIYKKNVLLERYIQKLVKTQDRNKRFFLIFHCEFSSERGPTLFRHLRKVDRQLNSDQYPHLYYPEMYLLEKGYSHFFEFHKDLCEPQNYIRMLDENYKEELVKYEEEKKKAGGKKKMSSLNLGASGSSGRTPAAFRSLNL